MKHKFFILSIFLFFSVASLFADEYDIVRVFEKVEVKDGTRGIDEWGNIEELNYILIPAEIDPGNYKVKITRKDSNLYKIENSDFYIETKFCYEYSSYEEVVIMIKNYGYSTCGKLVFID